MLHRSCSSLFCASLSHNLCMCVCVYFIHDLQKADNNEWGKFPNDLIGGEDWLCKCWWIHYSLSQLFWIYLRWYLYCGRNLSWWLTIGQKQKICQIYRILIIKAPTGQHFCFGLNRTLITAKWHNNFAPLANVVSPAPPLQWPPPFPLPPPHPLLWLSAAPPLLGPNEPSPGAGLSPHQG